MRTSAAALARFVLAWAVIACGAPVTPSPIPISELTVSVPILTTDKSVITAAVDVMSARLRALGIGNLTSSAGTNLSFALPFDGTVDRAAIDAVLRMPGVVSVIGWSADDGDTPQAGDPAPTGGTPVFDAPTQITSATVVKPSDAGGNPGVEVTLDPAGTQALAAWSKAHVGDSLVIVVDGTVLDSATVMSEIPDGHVVLSFPSTTSIRPDVIAAILASGPLPPGWTAP